ncbi:hypothetical protein ES703_50235 [subsurface metagenome]
MVALSIAGEPVEPARPSVPVAAQKVTSSARQGHLYIFPSLGVGFSDWGPGLSWGSQVGYGNESWGKVLIDYLGMDASLNVLALYEPGFRPLYWQLGLGWVSDLYYYDEDWSRWAQGLGFRVGLGYNYALGKYIMIRPAVELNLGLKEFQSNWAINLNFGFKTPNLW